MNETITWLQFKDLISVAAPFCAAIMWLFTSYKSDKEHLQEQIDALNADLRAFQLSVAEKSATKEDFKRLEDRVIDAIEALHGQISSVKAQK